jgi:hypothetical protein
VVPCQPTRLVGAGAATALPQDQVGDAGSSSGVIRLLDERQLQNMLIQFIITGSWTAVLVPIAPRQFQRAVAQQSVLTVGPRVAVGRPADWWVREKLATRILMKEAWKSEIQAACQSMGLSRVNLFRDLDNLGASIRQNFVNKIYV